MAGDASTTTASASHAGELSRTLTASVGTPVGVISARRALGAADGMLPPMSKRTEVIGTMRHRDWALLALLIPFILLLYPPLYAGMKPELDGIPLFIWYQFLMVIVGAVSRPPSTS